MSGDSQPAAERAALTHLSGEIDGSLSVLDGCDQCYAKRRMVTEVLLQAACQAVEAEEHARIHRYSEAERCARIAAMNRGFAAPLRNMAAL